MNQKDVSEKSSDSNASSDPHRLKLISAAALILVSTSAGFVGGWLGAGSRDGDSPQNIQQMREIISTESDVISQLVDEVGPRVVSVNVTSRSRGGGFFGRAFEAESAGTGFIISEDGVVVTNRHVIGSSATNITLTMSDGTELDDVEVIGQTGASDPLDVAFLKINDTKGKKLSPVRLGDSSQVNVGDKVVAIGNALGQFENTVTSGIISGYGRSVIAGGASGAETLQNLFQTDTAINQGNSGGPLLNMNGEVIGINTAVAGGGAENIGFAIPINDVKGLITSVLESGKLLRPYLGVRYVSLTDDIAYSYNLETKRGAYLLPDSSQEVVLPDSPAAKAGLQEGDIITRVNDTPIDEKNSLASVLGRFSVGERVELTIVRDGQERQIDVALEAAPTE